MKIIDGLRDQRQLGQLILQITNCSVRGVRGGAQGLHTAPLVPAPNQCEVPLLDVERQRKRSPQRWRLRGAKLQLRNERDPTGSARDTAQYGVGAFLRSDHVAPHPTAASRLSGDTERLNSCRPDHGVMCIGLCRGSRGPGSRHPRGDLKQLATGNHTHETPWPSGFRWCGRGRSAPGRTESRQTSHRAVSRSPGARYETPSR
jgi:hypothetical protein